MARSKLESSRSNTFPSAVSGSSEVEKEKDGSDETERRKRTRNCEDLRIVTALNFRIKKISIVVVVSFDYEISSSFATSCSSL